MTWGLVQAGNRASKTGRYLQWWENRPEWQAVTSTVRNSSHSIRFHTFTPGRDTLGVPTVAVPLPWLGCCWVPLPLGCLHPEWWESSSAMNCYAFLDGAKTMATPIFDFVFFLFRSAQRIMWLDFAQQLAPECLCA